MATNTYVALQSATVSGTSTGTITFTSIPSTYTDLVIVGNLGSETTNAFPYLQFNSDTGSNYSYTELYGNGSSAYSTRVSNNTQLFNNDVSVKQGSINSNVIYHIMNYANTTTYKTSLVRQNTVDAADYNGALAAVGLWRNTAAITSISIKLTRSGSAYNFSSGSTFTIYGISDAGDNGSKAIGGTVTSDANYYYHTFTMSGRFTPTQSLTADYLVVAGGGGGGGNGGAGGGAGGFRTATGQSLAVGNYQVLVGAGGSGVLYGKGTNGSDSSFNGFTSTGGGAASGVFASGGTDANDGGSGGGGNYNKYIGKGNTPSTTPSQGNDGGGSTTANNLGTGGGGGAGAVGGTGTATNCGVGGAGAASSMSGTSVTYAGGGGGGGNFGATPAAGGSGGGGAGGTGDGTSGTVNLGGGGGGGGATGGFGGSGIVIIRYAR